MTTLQLQEGMARSAGRSIILRQRAPHAQEGTDRLMQAIAVPIRTDADIVSARQTGRRMAAELGFTPAQLTMIATAISELARNVVTYAGSGEIVLELREDDTRRGILVVARDDGPGIADVEAALQDGFSTGSSLGLGLPGARRLMDEFDIVSAPGDGTTVTATKWAD